MLSDPNPSLPPSLQGLANLKFAGLGRNCIVFSDKIAEFLKVGQVLKTEYPKPTIQDGAFQFLRVEGGVWNKPLHLIPVPSARYSIPYLKDMVGPRNLIYIRTIKSALSLGTCTDSSACSPTTECLKCNEMIFISNLRVHNLTLSVVSYRYK